jgi:DNA-directed RNA polymerase II subunit RPB9
VIEKGTSFGPPLPRSCLPPLVPPLQERESREREKKEKKAEPTLREGERKSKQPPSLPFLLSPLDNMEDMTPEQAAATVSMQFCTMCNNLLHPEEDKLNQQLQYKCGTCSVVQPAQSQRVARHVLARQEEDRTIVRYDVGSDPTLPRTKITCPACGHDEAAFFQSYGTGRDTKMTIYLICCNNGCNNRWKADPGEDDDDLDFV